MDYRAFVAGLEPQVKIALTARSDAAGLLHLAGHGGGILLTGALIMAAGPGGWLLLAVQGILICFLFTLAHEATHKTPFASLAINEWAGRVSGFLLVLPFGWFRYFHLAHHRYTNIEGMDPELQGGKPENLRQWLWHVSGLTFWIAGMRLIWRLARGTERAAYLPEHALPRMRTEALWMLTGYALCAATLIWSPILLWVWVIPALIGQPFLRLYLLAEHGDCRRVADMLQNTRTTFTSRTLRFLAWNMPYHTEHHVYPAVPFHRLPDLHALMKHELRVTADGYVAFNRDFLARRVRRL